MSNTNQNGSAGILKPIDIICDYHDILDSKVKKADALVEAIETTKEFRAFERWYKLCCLSLSKRTHHFYQDIDNYQLFDLYKSSGALQGSIDDHIKTNDELEKKLQETSKVINEMRTKLHNAHNAACAMENCIKGTIALEDHPAIGTALNPILGDPTIQEDKGIAEELDEKGRCAADGIAQIAGIQTFSNIDILKSFGKIVAETVKSLKGIVDDNIKKGGDEVKKAQEDLTKVLEELNKLKFDRHREGVMAEGLTGTHDFICCNGDDTEGCMPTATTIEEICQSMCEETPLRIGDPDEKPKVVGKDER